MVKINKELQYGYWLYDPNGTPIGQIDNELQLLDVRIQIVENQLNGYYIEMNGEKMEFDEFSVPKSFPDTFEGLNKMLKELLKAQMTKRKEKLKKDK